jgi:hypothetical protein
MYMNDTVWTESRALDSEAEIDGSGFWGDGQ